MLLSFVVPVYNVEDYLRECLDSLLDQDLSPEDYEILCIDDGSTDSGPQILAEMEANHGNLRVLRQTNSGVSAARNRGIEEARGDYLWFVDSDDLIARNILGKLKQIVSGKDYDRVAFNYYSFRGSLRDEEREAYLQGILRGPHTYQDANIWTSIMKRSVLVDHQLRFSKSSHGEDSLFMFEFSLHGKNQLSLEETVYYYRLRGMSAMTTNTPEAHRKRYISHRNNALVMKAYYEGKKGEIQDRERCANLFVSFLDYALWEVTLLPLPQAREKRKELHAYGLYPYRKPRECTLKSSYQNSGKGLKGKLFDYLYLHQSSRLGFALLWLYQHTMNRHKH